MARVKVFTDRGWIEIPPPYTDICVIENKRIQVTTIRGFVSFSSTNEYLSEYGEYMDECGAESRPKGKWLEDTGLYATCSNCKENLYQAIEYKFCPNCGAEMENE